MAIEGMIFDLYGTLIDIETDEVREDIYRSIAHFLTYQGIYLHRNEVRDLYYQILKDMKGNSAETYPEIDILDVWSLFLEKNGMNKAEARKSLSTVLAQLYRGISRKRLSLYPNVIKVLDELKPKYRLAVVSDAQACWALPEMKAVGLSGYFDPIIISSNYGYRKPDPRSFKAALDALLLTPGEALFVGNDMYRDIFGAKQMRIKTIFRVSNQGDQSHADTVPDYVVKDLSELPQILAFLSSSL